MRPQRQCTDARRASIKVSHLSAKKAPTLVAGRNASPLGRGHNLAERARRYPQTDTPVKTIDWIGVTGYFVSTLGS